MPSPGLYLMCPQIKWRTCTALAFVFVYLKWQSIQFGHSHLSHRLTLGEILIDRFVCCCCCGCHESTLQTPGSPPGSSVSWTAGRLMGLCYFPLQCMEKVKRKGSCSVMSDLAPADCAFTSSLHPVWTEQEYWWVPLPSPDDWFRYCHSLAHNCWVPICIKHCSKCWGYNIIKRDTDSSTKHLWLGYLLEMNFYLIWKWEQSDQTLLCYFHFCKARTSRWPKPSTGYHGASGDTGA